MYELEQSKQADLQVECGYAYLVCAGKGAHLGSCLPAAFMHSIILGLRLPMHMDSCAHAGCACGPERGYWERAASASADTPDPGGVSWMAAGVGDPPLPVV